MPADTETREVSVIRKEVALVEADKNPAGGRTCHPLAPRPPLRFDIIDVESPNGRVTGLVTETIGDAAGAGKAHIPFLKNNPAVMQKDSGSPNLLSDMHQLMWQNIEYNLECPGIRMEDNWSNDWNTLQDKIVLLLSPGPSLEEMLPAIERLRGQPDIHVMGINRVIRGPKLDSWVCIERRVPKDWFDTKKHFPDTKLYATPQTCSRITPYFDTVRWGFTNMGGFGWDKRISWLDLMDGQALSTPSTALWMQHKLKPKAVILLGNDFCIRHAKINANTMKMTRTYFDQDFADSNYAQRQDYQPNFMMFCQDKWTGTPVMCNRALLTFRDTFEAMCWVIDEEMGIPVVNASGFGMLNWRNMKLDDALEACRSL